MVETLVRSRDEYAIYVNRSQILERESSTLSEQPLNSSDEFERRGLSWLTALLRVELGALTAGFTDFPDPFAWIPPGNADVEEYAEVLLDSLRTHYWACATTRSPRTWRPRRSAKRKPSPMPGG